MIWFVLTLIIFVFGFSWCFCVMPRCSFCKKRIWPTKENQLYDHCHAKCYWKK
jgi:hypothetical protein